MSLAIYNKYKDSGVEWLGDIPNNWEVKRIKDLIFKIGSGVTPKGGGEVYVDKGIPLVRSQNVYDDGLRLDNVSFITEEINNRMPNSQLKPNDILINITGASIGRSCIVPVTLKKANINQHIIYLRAKKSIVPYLSTYIKSNSIKGYIMLIQAGSSKEALNMGQTLNIPILIPSFSEQTAIASYLDLKTSAIDRKVALLEQKIAHYQQLRKSLINETVCRGLNKNVKLKDSGIEWIGMIPEHWEVKRLKDMDEIIMGQSPNSEDYNYVFEGFPFLQGNAEFGLLNPSPSIWCSTANKVINAKDILVSVRAPIGAINISDRQYGIGRGLCAVRAKKSHYKFLYYHFSVRTEDLNSVGTGTTYIAISLNGIKNLHVAYPPLSEQTIIVAYLDEKAQKIDNIVYNIKSQIETLKELRKTLINDVVTGKIKVSD